MGSYSLGGYASWEHESGFYLDGIVKLNRFESNVAGKMSSGGAANGSYRSNGLGGHIETGMRFTDGNWNLTPYASLTGSPLITPNIIYPMVWNRNQSIPAVYIVNWAQR